MGCRYSRTCEELLVHGRSCYEAVCHLFRLLYRILINFRHVFHVSYKEKIIQVDAKDIKGDVFDTWQKYL